MIAESILNTLQQPILVLSGELQPKFANPAFYKMFGIAEGDLDGNQIKDFIAGKNFDTSMNDFWESIVTSKVHVEGVETLCTLETESKQPFHLILEARRVPQKGLIEMIIVEPHDVSIVKEAEVCINDLNDKLRNRVITLDEVNEELESYSHSVSHDLRSPLRFVSKIAHLLLTDPETTLSEEASAQINLILMATDEMGLMIERLLLFSQASREPMIIRRVDLQKLFQKIAKEQKNREEGRDVEIEVQEMEPCEGDHTLLKQVVVNLMENAFKFTQRREGAKITIGCTEKDGEHVYFVKDNGAGFDMMESSSLFVPFHRLHNKEEFKGTGIGLPLVKRIIERHGGKIWAEGKVNEGATFYFTLGKVAKANEENLIKD